MVEGGVDVVGSGGTVERPVVIGVDAAGSTGWVGVAIADRGFLCAGVAATIGELVVGIEHELGRELSVIGIDIPIGLVDGPSRSADLAARAFVGPRRSSVFPAPHPEVVDLDDYAAVNARLAELGLKQTSRQAFGLYARIREVRELSLDPAIGPRLIEVFPEASFCAMAGRHLRSGKKSWNGAAERRTLLAHADPPIVLPDDVGPAGAAVADDIFDAAAAAWSAWRHAHGRAQPYGDESEVDEKTGRRIAMWV